MVQSDGKGIPIKVNFVSEIKDGSKSDRVAFTTNGLYYIKGKTTYLSFNESEAPHEIKTIVKINEHGDVLIMRKGAVSMKQYFQQHKETYGKYRNEIGLFEMVTTTEQIKYEWTEDKKSGYLLLTYLLRIQGELAGRYNVTIQFREEQI
ncbi:MULTISPECIES: DUF1934 domain-containing protein [Bacillaceae]|uniref:DUF1934 domain-containing protein n=1 Tax=Bacillaceae TaxID=186817 RepID=UPI001BDE7CBB|nr:MULTISPECIES: DUF1934 domain-containing protein [Bacillaceae]MDX8361031.1 DUF1934 domain-containing protein [Cytobacillus sp. IB215316]MDX8363655.1 DUF1934 domain-containing protein [Cytobacillus sp. IB215665]